MEQGTIQKDSQPRDIFDLDYPHRELDENVKIFSKFRADNSNEKCYLNYTYKTEDMKFYTFNSIRKAEKLVMNDTQATETSIRGYPAYIEASEKILFSHSPKLVSEQRIAGVQTVSGTEALRLGFEFIKANIPAKVYVPQPSYGNHIPIPEACDLEVLTYSYVQHGADNIDWKSFNHILSTAEKNSIFLLQPFCQNPTGIDPTLSEWRTIAQTMKQRGLIPFFDVSFLGMMTGDIDEDNLVLQIFLDEGLQIIIAHSFSKIMSLYGERIGVLLVVCSSTEIAQRVQSQLEEEVINLHGGSPLYPARLVAAVLTTPEIFEEWKEELKGVYNRIAEIRKKLVDALSAFGNDRNWKSISRQKGFFTLLPLTPEECGTLVDKHHIYLLSNGRISLGALNDEKIELLKNGIKKLFASKSS